MRAEDWKETRLATIELEDGWWFCHDNGLFMVFVCDSEENWPRMWVGFL